MSVSLRPSSSLAFNRPLTQLVKRVLTVTNNNEEPVAFKVKTTAPKLYCVRPNSGRIEPGESVEVQVLLQAMKEEPPANAKCKDKFLVQSTIITPEKEAMTLHDLWNNVDGEETKVHQQKIKVVYLPPVGQAVEEEDEGVNQSSMMSHGDSTRFEPVRESLSGQNGHASGFPTEPHPPVERAFSPAVGDYSVADEEAHLEEHGHEGVPFGEQTHVPPSPPIKQQSSSSSADDELRAHLAAAQAEIARLRGLLASVPDPNGPGLRHRNRVLSDDGTAVSSSGETDVGTAVDQAVMHSDGVPPQYVVGISLFVFILTYLFF